MLVEEFLETTATRVPDKPAIVAPDGRLSYRRFDALANRFAWVLKEHGVQRGDRVVIYLDNSLEAAAAVFGTLKADAVFSPVNASTKTDKLAYILNHCRARALITHARLLPTAAQAVDQAPSVVATIVAGTKHPPAARATVVLEKALDRAPEVAPPRATIDIDLAMLIYTSGSTGQPKGVMMTHLNIVTAATSITTYLENTPDDIILNVLPLSFDYGLYQLLMSTKIGATLVLERSFAYPELVLQTLRRDRVTGFPIVPTMAAMLLQMKSLRAGSFPDLRYISNTGAALPPDHIARLQALFPSTRIYSMYGLTECKRCTYLPPDELARRPGSVGKAIPNTEGWVVNDHGQRCGPGEVGELVIRGAHVMQGYWNEAEATAERLRPGANPWERVLHTGDLFKTDDEGFLYFVGRKDDIIKTRGEKVSPKEVENVLYALPEVKEAAVVGVPDPILGMAVKAVLVVADGARLTTQDVLRHCAARLEDVMVPRIVEFRRELPKTTSGKIRRSDVQAEALAGAVRAPGL
jgi:amino acid adenylation domain-containing protein